MIFCGRCYVPCTVFYVLLLGEGAGGNVLGIVHFRHEDNVLANHLQPKVQAEKHLAVVMMLYANKRHYRQQYRLESCAMESQPSTEHYLRALLL